MIKPAQLYAEELRTEFYNISYDLNFQFFFANTYVNEYVPDKDTWNKHEFAILNKKKNVIGFVSYGINRNTYSAGNLRIINFIGFPNYIFSKDLCTILKNIFEKYRFNKLSFGCVIGNPIEESYDKMIDKYGGRIVGVEYNQVKTLDGKIYDFKIYEISRDNYFTYKTNINNKGE